MLKRSFHGGASMLLMGRKSGATAFEQGPRELSKKQKRRRTNRLIDKLERVDQKKMKIKETHLSNQLASLNLTEMIEETQAKLGDTLKQLMIPDGAHEFAGENKSNNRPKKFYVDPTILLKHLEAKGMERKHKLLLTDGKESDSLGDSVSNEIILTTSSKETAISGVIAEDEITYQKVIEGVRQLLEQSTKTKEVMQMLQLMPDAGIIADSKIYTIVMAHFSSKNVRNYRAAEEAFDLMVKSGVEPNERAWSALVNAKAKGKGPSVALELIDRLKSTGVNPTVHMFTSVLNAMIDRRQYDDAQELWLRMHEEDINLTKEAFTTMLKQCAKTGQVERAFFYMDEMRSYDAEPDIRTYVLLFRACAEAPHWVDGYHDIIFDAMAKMEGAELMPTAEVYNAIIYAFSRAGDPVAAEFYFEEMRRKGIRPGVYTFNTLLNAFRRSQSVGASSYGSKGRYVRLPERAPSDEEQAYMDVGATKVSSLLSKGLWKEGEKERGSRQFGHMEDILDDDLDAQEAFSHEIRTQAAAIRRQRQAALGGDSLGLVDGLDHSEGNVDHDDDYDYDHSKGAIGSRMEEQEEDEEDQIYKDFFLSERKRDSRKHLPSPGNRDHANTSSDMRKEISSDSTSVTNVASHHQNRRNQGGGSGSSINDIHAYDELHEEVDFEAMAAHDPALRKLIDDIDARDRERRDKGKLAKIASQQTHEGSTSSLLSSSASQPGLGYPKDKTFDMNDEEFDKYIASVSEEEFHDSEHEEDDDEALEGGDDTEDNEDVLFTSADKSFLDGSDAVRSSVRDNKRIRRELLTADDLEHLMRSVEDEDEDDERNELPYVRANKKAVAAGMQAAKASLQGRKTIFSSSLATTSTPTAVDGTMPAAAVDRSTMTVSQVKHRNRLVNLLDNDTTLNNDTDGLAHGEYDDKWTRVPLSSSSSTIPDDLDNVSMADIDKMWRMVEFGRAPDPDYTISLSDRRGINIEKAENLMIEMKKSKIRPDVVTLTTLMGVYSEALRVEDALDLFHRMEKQYGVKPNSSTYRTLVRMHILNKDITAAMKMKEDMIKLSLKPDAETYGMLIQSMTHRDMVVESLQLLEEATKSHIEIADRHVRYLRSRCVSLGIKHPNMPLDPKAWAKEVKKMRHASKFTSKRRVEHVKSAMYM